MPSVIHAEKVSYKINERYIIQDINFKVEKGEFISIIGPNGAGKTTLMKCLANNLKYQGKILLNEKPIESYSMKEKAQVMGVVPQEYNLPFNFKVHEIITMGRNPYVTKKRNLYTSDQRVVEMSMHQTNTYEYKDRYYNSLSGGEKQRVITARALAQEPEILLLDEFTSNLDIHNQLEILELIYDLNRLKGMTVISVMHDLNMASRFSDKIMLMIDGKIEQFEPVKTVMQEKVLSKAYKMDMIIRENKILNRYEVIPLRVKTDKKIKNIHIHIVSGGGTGEYILEKLFSMGYQMSCGVLAEGDSDIDVCRSLQIDYISDDPFNAFGETSICSNREKMRQADKIILTDVPFGRNNLINLKMIEELNDTPIIILHGVNRDYVHGEADALLEKLVKRDNVSVAMNLDQLFKLLEDEN